MDRPKDQGWTDQWAADIPSYKVAWTHTKIIGFGCRVDLARQMKGFEPIAVLDFRVNKNKADRHKSRAW